MPDLVGRSAVHGFGIHQACDSARLLRVVGMIFSVAAILWAIGCLKPGPQTSTAAMGRPWHKLYEQTLTEFELATFYKPREGSMEGLEADLAPLIIQQVMDANAESVLVRDWKLEPAGFGAVFIDEQGDIHVDTTQPTVYVGTSIVTVHGIEYDQVLYIWWYAPIPQNHGDARAEPQGVRMTLDSDGFPLVWEVVSLESISSSEPGARALFVSSRLERAAADAFGPPLPGRRFAVERSVADATDTVVVRVIEDGPIPMGPFVYLSAHTHAATTVLCRCSSSQVERILEAPYYDLQPLDHLDALGSDRAEWAANRGSPLGENRLTRTETKDDSQFEKILRWPPR